MEDKKYYYEFANTHHYVYVVAFYGNYQPVIVKGYLVLKTYYTDASRKEIDIKHTSLSHMDGLFYETNKVLREAYGDSYNGKRELIELSMPELGNEYRIVYNTAEIPSERHDDALGIIRNRDSEAHGVAIILKRDEKGIHYLEEAEARKILEYYTND